MLSTPLPLVLAASAWPSHSTSRASHPGLKRMWESTCRKYSSPAHSRCASMRALHGPVASR